MRIAPLIGFPARQLTHTTIKQNLTDRKIQLQTLKAIERVFDPDIIFFFMDLSVEAEALGLEIDFPEDGIPTVLEHPVDSEEQSNRLRDIDFFNSRMKLFIELTKSFKEVSNKKLGAYAIGPYSLTSILMGTGNAAMSILSNPKLIRKVMKFSTDLIIRYTQQLEKNGADYIVILEPTAVTLSPAQFRQFNASYLDEISYTIKKNIILHICGNTTHLFGEMKDLGGIYGVSLDANVDLFEAHAIIQKPSMGNISPALVSYGDYKKNRRCSNKINTSDEWDK